MNKVGGNRNYGYGKQLAWAGKNALADRYGEGHFSTRASHEQRWQVFSLHMKQIGIKDARQINQTHIQDYANQLKVRVEDGEMKVAYAQNLLSTVNVVLQTMRKDTTLKISPSDCVGKRLNVRTTVPVSLASERTDRALEFQCVKNAPSEIPVEIRDSSHFRIILVAQLCRTFGLRFKEASLLNANRAQKEAKRYNRINITEGTKGGRGKGADRWVPVNEQQLALLQRAAEFQKYQSTQNLIPPKCNYKEWRDGAYNTWRETTKDTPLNGFHDLRAAYACERYHQITGYPAPVVTGQRQVNKELDTYARTILTSEMGHHRTDVVAAYIGSAK